MQRAALLLPVVVGEAGNRLADAAGPAGPVAGDAGKFAKPRKRPGHAAGRCACAQVKATGRRDQPPVVAQAGGDGQVHVGVRVGQAGVNIVGALHIRIRLDDLATVGVFGIAAVFKAAHMHKVARALQLGAAEYFGASAEGLFPAGWGHALGDLCARGGQGAAGHASRCWQGELVGAHHGGHAVLAVHGGHGAALNQRHAVLYLAVLRPAGVDRGHAIGHGDGAGAQRKAGDQAAAQHVGYVGFIAGDQRRCAGLPFAAEQLDSSAHVCVSP